MGWNLPHQLIKRMPHRLAHWSQMAIPQGRCFLPRGLACVTLTNWLALLGRRAQLDSSYIISVNLHWKFGKRYTCPAALTHPGIVGVKRIPKVTSFPLPQLEDRVLDWQSSPASSLNSWFSAAPNWAELVLPALQYLAGESRGEVFSVGVHHVFPLLSKELILAVNCSCSFVQ